MNAEKLLTRQEAADYLRVSLGTLTRYCREEGLRFLKLGTGGGTAAIRFREKDLLMWVDSRQKEFAGG